MKSLKMDMGTRNFIERDFILLGKVIKDRGYIYFVSVGNVKNRKSIKKFIKKVRNYNKRFQKAIDFFATRIRKDGVFYGNLSDDGVDGAGKVI